MIAAALAFLDRSAREVAVTVTTFGLGVTAGAVYRPPEEICPHAIPVQPRPDKLQITTGFVVPVTCTVN
jgi:hypothetical protein